MISNLVVEIHKSPKECTSKYAVRAESHIPTVVPAECMEYFRPHFFSSRCTDATSLDTDAVGVPSGMRQKSDVLLVGRFT